MEEIKKKKKKSKWRYLRRFIIKIIFFFILIWSMFTYVFGWIRADGNKMFPMIKDGDFCLYSRIEDGYIGDAVVYTGSDGTLLVGRVAAIEGQSVDFPEEGGYLVDGVMPSEILPYETYNYESSEIKYPLLLDDDEYYILNDYREDMSDSRTTGIVKKNDILGKIIFVLRRRSI